MTLKVQLKNVYGTERIYPVNDTAERMTRLLDRKTFTKRDIEQLKAIGFKVQWVAGEL